VEKPAETITAPKEPPAPVEELPPTEKPEGDNVQWIPGYWAWDQDLDDFIWVSGVWRDIPPGREWVPGYWTTGQGRVEWVPGYWIEAGQREVQYLPPPPASLEVGPSIEAPRDDYTYVPGCFVYRQARYLWRPGFWIAPHPGWCWTPARYAWTPLGYIFVDGYWDYALHRRGLIFAPVHFNRTVLARPRWRFQPSYVVSEPALAGAMFVHPSTGHYYFGNYFDPRYERRGFVPWVDFRIGRRVADPLFAQMRYQHREPERWEKTLRAMYSERRTNEAARPAIDLARQEARRDAERDRNSLLTSLSRVDRNTLKLTQVPDSTRDELTRRIRERRDDAEQRRSAELRERAAITQGPGRSEPGRADQPRADQPRIDQPRTVRRNPSEAETKSSPRRAETPPGEAPTFN